MSITIDQTGRLKSEKMSLATTAQTTVYSANDRVRPVVVGLRLTNTTGSTVSVTVALYDAVAASDFQLTGTVSLAANQSLEPVTLPLALLDNDSIKVTAGTGNALDVVVTALEGVGR